MPTFTTPEGAKSSINRAYKYLVRQKAGVNEMIQTLKDGSDTTDQTNDLNSNLLTLEKQQQDFEHLLVQFEQLDLESGDFEDELEKWGDASHEALQALYAGRSLLTSRSDSLPISGENQAAGTSMSANTNSAQSTETSIDRLVAAIELQHGSQNQAASATIQSTSRLPKLELPKFNGDIMKWKPFHDRFTASVHNNPKLAPVEKLNYLMSQLDEEPLQMVENIPFTNENYLVALDMLTKRYGDQKLLITKLYRSLNEIKPVKEDSNKVREFVTEVDRLMGTLTALGQDINSENFATIILSKLPQKIVMDLEMIKDLKDDWTVKLLREKLSEYIIKLERSSKMSSNNGKQSDRSGAVEYTADALHVTESKFSRFKREPQKQTGRDIVKTIAGSMNQRDCVFCGKSHWSDMCKTYPDLTSRRKKLGRRCYNCFDANHLIKDCPRKKPCYHCKKYNAHHSALCDVKFSARKEHSHIAAEDSTQEKSEQIMNESEAGLLAAGEEVVLQTALVNVTTAHKKASTAVTTVSTRLLFDSGANRSYCTQALATKLGLQTKQGPSLVVNRFGTNKPTSLPTKTAEICLKTVENKTVTIEVSVIPVITGELTRVPINNDHFNKMKTTLKLADEPPRRHESGDIGILIGSDYYLDLVSGQKIQVSKGLYLISSDFGWILNGRTNNDRNRTHTVSMFCLATGTKGYPESIATHQFSLGEAQIQKPDLSEFWSMETLGIKECPRQSDDERAIMDFQSHIKMIEGRYFVSLPWNERVRDLNSNYGLAAGRLQTLLRKLQTNSDLFQQYNEIIKQQEQLGIIERVKSTENNNGGNIHYIPHHAVIKSSSETTKVRIVFDGSAKLKKNAPSLNDCLLRGPVLLEDLAGLLIRFRLHPIAVVSDIEKAFLQVGIRLEDRDATRFVWLKNTDMCNSHNNIQEFRFARVPFGLNCSPALLAQTIHYHLKQFNGPTAQKIEEGLYVDNVITGVEDVEEGKNFYNEAKALFNAASMNLREWQSNSHELVSQFPSIDKAKPLALKVLGLQWDTRTDTISVIGPAPAQIEKAATKRELLAATAAVFDPLGYFTPCTMQARVNLQKISQTKINWDDRVEPEIAQKWSNEMKQLSELPNVAIKRHIPAKGKMELIAFTDASSQAYAACIYLRTVTPQGVHTGLLMAKMRLNPPKGISIPRGELMGVLIGTRLIDFAKKQLRQPVGVSHLFCDSKVVLSWIQSEKSKETFVRNRVSEIRQGKQLIFHYVNTNDNPADWATRGKKPQDLNEFWWSGPEWLCWDQKSWPTWDFLPFEYTEPIQRSTQVHSASMIAQTETTQSETNQHPFDIDLQKYSTIKKVLWVTATCMKAIHKWLKKENQNWPINSSDLTEAKIMWEKSVQQEVFSDIKQKVENGKKHNMSQLGLFLDKQGLLRCKGRLGFTQMDYDPKYPKLMPKKHQYTKLIIADCHNRCGHGSASHTLAEVRKEYWIPGARSKIAKYINACVICKKASGKPFARPTMPELPTTRVVKSACFKNTGLDYFGPLKVKCYTGIRKCWVALFTCLTTRALHLELVMDLSAKEFLMALRRFISRRGKPETIVSDNAPQFKLTAEITMLPWVKSRDNEISRFATNSGIKWSFITAYAPYMGGVYERMVGIVKTSLRKTIGQALLTVKQLETCLSETEATVNSRPLVHVSSDSDPYGIITPAHFLSLNPDIGPAFHNVEATDSLKTMQSNAERLQEEWIKGQNILNEFWRVWSQDYLNLLRERSHYDHRGLKGTRAPVNGEVVLLQEKGSPRGAWKLARIMEAHPSADGAIRSCSIKMPNGKILKRPVSLLIPLESQNVPKDNQSSEKPQIEEIEKVESQETPESTDPDTSEEIILAKLKGYPIWPAQRLTGTGGTPLAGNKARKGWIPVKFFQTGRFAFVPPTQVYPFKAPTLEEIRNVNLRDAFQMADEQQKKKKKNEDTINGCMVTVPFPRECVR